MVSGVIKKIEIQIFGVETSIETKVETLCLPTSRVFSFFTVFFIISCLYYILILQDLIKLSCSLTSVH